MEKQTGLSLGSITMHGSMHTLCARWIHDERAGLWEEHMAELENMLLYLVAAGRCKYVSCLPH